MLTGLVEADRPLWKQAVRISDGFILREINLEHRLRREINLKKQRTTNPTAQTRWTLVGTASSQTGLRSFSAIT